ncbi:glycosyl hydrolase BNR repeat-containing protein [Tricladium varicosporioides]|nr:glycosyl hydrolase BNR repeat-containing protein [Hymenoscyphus varicosporioides]
MSPSKVTVSPSIIPPLGIAVKQVSTVPSRSESYLPTTTTQSHASSLLLLPSGDLLCAWFGGKQEGIPDISIYASRLPANSETWLEAEKLSNDPGRSEQNPVLFQSPQGPVWLLWTSQDGGNQESAIVKKRVSLDGGKTWGQVETLFSDEGTFIRQPMVVLHDGAWVIPIFKCRAEKGERWIGNDDISCVRVSRDQGITWEETGIPNSYGCVHMAIIPLKSGKYLGLFRSRWADFIYSSTSDDGIHWNQPSPTELPNPNAGIGATILKSGRVALLYNNSSGKGIKERREGLYDDITSSDDTRKNQQPKHGGRVAIWGAPRAPLCFAISDDEGKTWRSKTLEDGDGYCMTNNSEQKLNRELSYPSIVVDENGTIHAAFTFWRQTIKYVRLREDFIEP